MGRPAGSKNKPKDGVETPPNDSAPKGQSAPRGSWPEGNAIQASFTDTLQGIGLLVEKVNKDDGQSIYKGASKLSEALVDLARKDPRYRKYLEKGSQPGKYGPIIMASGSILLPIAMNHGLLDGLFGPKKEKKAKPVETPRADGVTATPVGDVPDEKIAPAAPAPIFSDAPDPFEDEMHGVPRQSSEHILMDNSDNLSSLTPDVHYLAGVTNLEGE